MYQIQRVLNNNSVLVTDSHGEQIIFVGKGIGFHKKPKESFVYEDWMDVFRFSKNNDKGDAMDILDSVDPVFIEAAARIIHKAQEAFGEVDTNILLPLADHIAFSIERMKQDMVISNPFANEIKLLFNDEYVVALEGKKIIQQLCGFEISEDEVGYITLHVHSALCAEKVPESMQAAIIIKESIEQVEKDFDISIDVNSMSYIRLMNHMKFLLWRLQSGEKLQVDVSEFILEKFPYAYATAQRICADLAKALKKELSEVEIGYLALHIERIRTSELEKKDSYDKNN